MFTPTSDAFKQKFSGLRKLVGLKQQEAAVCVEIGCYSIPPNYFARLSCVLHMLTHCRLPRKTLRHRCATLQVLDQIAQLAFAAARGHGVVPATPWRHAPSRLGLCCRLPTAPGGL